MNRILRHVGAKDFRKTHQRKLDEQRALYLERREREIQEQKEKRILEKLSAPYKSDWKSEIFLEEIKVNQENSLEDKLSETIIPFIKNKKYKDTIFNNFSDFSDWRKELLDEGMTTKDFYGYGISTIDIPIVTSILNPVQSTLAQDIVNASAETTDYAFGPQFPGSYVNQVGGVESLSKVDVVASHDGTLPEVPEGQNPAPELPDNAIPIDTSIQGSYAVDGETRHRIYKYKNGVLQNTLNNEYLFYSNPWQIDRGLILPRNERGWALQVYGRNTGASFLSTINIAVWQEDFVNGDVYTFRIEPVNAEGNPHLITLHASTGSTGRPKNSSFEKTTDAADLGAPVAAFDPNRKDRKRGGNPDSLQLDPEIEKIDASITDPQERNLIDKAKDAVLDFAADIIGARSAKNALDSYNKFLANPKGPGSSPDKPLDITNNFTKKDIGILRSAVTNDAYSKDKIRQAIESSGKSQHIQDLRWEVAIGAVETAIRDASSKSEGLNNSIHGGGTLDREAFIRSGGKEITFIKPYGFRPGGSVAQFEKSPFGRLMNATGLPADTIGAGGNPAVVVGGVIASQLMLNNAKKHGGIYKAPTAYMKVNISSGTMKESTNFDYEGKPSPNGFPDTPPPQGNLLTKKTMKSFKQFKKELYPGQPSPNGFPDTPPAQMSPNGYHSEYGKQGKMYNRMDRATAMAMPLTKDPEIDAKILAARNQPK